MFLNRGMLDAAKTDGEVVGVMAHEISHVVLRHGTAQATKGQKFQIGAIAGQVARRDRRRTDRAASSRRDRSSASAPTFLKYSREYEREADLMGAQIMARAGYDPRQMANMFQTIQKQGGSQGPEWLSDHPNPGNRYEAINEEAEALGVTRSSAPAGRDRERACAAGEDAPAITSAQAARQAQQRQRTGGPRAARWAARDRATSSRRPPVAHLSARQLHAAQRARRTGSRSAAATRSPTRPTEATSRRRTATRPSPTASRSASRRAAAATCSRAPSSCCRASPAPTPISGARAATVAHERSAAGRG